MKVHCDECGGHISKVGVLMWYRPKGFKRVRFKLCKECRKKAEKLDKVG